MRHNCYPAYRQMNVIMWHLCHVPVSIQMNCKASGLTVCTIAHIIASSMTMLHDDGYCVEGSSQGRRRSKQQAMVARAAAALLRCAGSCIICLFVGYLAMECDVGHVERYATRLSDGYMLMEVFNCLVACSTWVCLCFLQAGYSFHGSRHAGFCT